MIIVQETAPGQFTPWRGGNAVKTCRTATRIVSYEDGRVEQTDIEVEPYEATVRLPSRISTAWSDDELASMKLYRVTPLRVPVGKLAVNKRVERRNGSPIEVADFVDAPPR